MVLMAFKKQEKAKPRDTMSLALHCFSKRTILKACKMQHKIVESWVKTPSNPKLIDQRALSEKNPLFAYTLGVCPSLLFSFRHSSAFGPGDGAVCSLPHASRNGICLPSQTGGQAVTERALSPSGYVAL